MGFAYTAFWENGQVFPSIEEYSFAEAANVITPALLVYPSFVEANISATIKMAGADPNRWRPHIKTAKIPAVLRMLRHGGIRNLKCSTTLELLKACEGNFPDVLLAFAVMGANAARTLEIAGCFPATRVSVLVENSMQAEGWLGKNVGLFLDVNPGMNRTGAGQDATAAIVAIARSMGAQFRGLHYYDGHLSGVPMEAREKAAHQGYHRLLELVGELERQGKAVEEVITSGTPAAPFGISFPGFRNASFVHRISPGTVVYNDLSSLAQLPAFGYRPAALVLATVVSHPTPNVVTCDAGHKGVSVDSGVPNCMVLGYEHLVPLKPSEEHLPIENPNGGRMPAIGEQLYLVPRHVCPTVNNFDHALFVRGGRIESLEQVAARGHERPIAAVA